MPKAYPSDVTDQQWDIIQALIPVNRLGRPREVNMRERKSGHTTPFSHSFSTPRSRLKRGPLDHERQRHTGLVAGRALSGSVPIPVSYASVRVTALDGWDHHVTRDPRSGMT